MTRVEFQRLAPAMVLLFACLSACNKAQNQPADVADADPASGNLAPASQVQPVSTAAPESNAPDQNYYPPAETGTAESPQTVEASEPPPPLPQYSQPPCPGDNYLWTPGYWDYSTTGYYWVPGAWVLAPWVGALWTPPWWGYNNGVYLRHAGYWAPHIGFYGGIDYGFGYTGRGYYGAYWNHGAVYYNRSVTSVNSAVVHNVYNYQAPNHGGARISYNGGRGGINERPTPQELAVRHDPRMAAVPAQIQHTRQAAANPAQFVAHGRVQPAALAAPKPLATTYRAPASHPPEAAMRAAARPAGEPHAQAQPRAETPAARPEVPHNRPEPQAVQRPESKPAPEVRRPTPETRAVQHPAAQPRPETHPAITQHPAAQPHPETHPAMTQHPAAQPHPETRPAITQHPAAQPRPESRPATVQHPAAQVHPESHPPAVRPRPIQKPAERKPPPRKEEERKPQ